MMKMAIITKPLQPFRLNADIPVSNALALNMFQK